MSVDWSQVTWYSRSRGTVATGPTVSISKAGRVVLNEEALSLFGEFPDSLNVGIVRGQRGKTTLVLGLAQESDAGSLALTKQGRKRSLNTKKFLSDLGLDNLFGNVESQKVDYDHQHKALVVSL